MEWHDAYSPNGTWKSVEAMRQDTACKCFSVGLYVCKNKEGDIILAGSWDTSSPKPTINNIMARPIKMIQNVTLLKKGKKTK